MKRQILLLVIMLSWAMAIPAQETVSVKFTAATETGQYCSFNSVIATNETRGWTEILVYPDTLLILSNTGVIEHTGVGLSIGTAYPNPFTDETSVPLELSEACDVQLRVIGADGTVLVSCSQYLNAGSHCVVVQLSNAGLAYLTITTPLGSMVSKLIGMGDGVANSLAVKTISAKDLRETNVGFTRGDAPGEFVPGDMMRYEALLVQDGMTLYSEVVRQKQYNSETVTLRFDIGFEHPEYVDLGLPSGILWAKRNVEAYQPEDFGLYFAWGETQQKSNYVWETYKYWWNDSMTKYNESDQLTTLQPNDDAATSFLGNGWRTPTKEEWQELFDNTTNTWTNQNGVYGRLFIAPNGNSLFLPAAGFRHEGGAFYVSQYGFYWSSSRSENNPFNAWYIRFDADTLALNAYIRIFGLPIRPVRSPNKD